MKLLDFPKKEKRDTPLTVRLSESTINKLKAIAKKYKKTQTEVIEHLIEAAHKEMTG